MSAAAFFIPCIVVGICKYDEFDNVRARVSDELYRTAIDADERRRAMAAQASLSVTESRLDCRRSVSADDGTPTG